MIAHFNNIEYHIIKYIQKWESCLVCTCWISSERIIDELSTLAHSECILNYQSSYDQYSSSFNKKLCKQLRDSFCQIYLHKGVNLMHHKFMVFIQDDIPRAVLTGSYNYTEQAKKNMENIIYIEDSNIAKQYYDEYCLLKSECELYHQCKIN
jgi:phosphatidylserine/phosphatidylglycerophosphate/cardiolipin synthase-like enzyme